MFRSIAVTAAALLLTLSGSAQACSCIEPPPLSQCAVNKGEAAVLVTLDCVTTVACSINDGVAVADVTVQQVFKDETDLGLENGDKVTISSGLSGAGCGIGGSFFPSGRWIMFVRPASSSSSLSSTDASACDVKTSDLTTNLCAGNIREPTSTEIEQLARGCASSIDLRAAATG